MFTGLVEKIGAVQEIERKGNCLSLSVGRPLEFDGIKAGDSVSVNGVCLTVAYLDEDVMVFDVVEESLRRSTVGGLRKGDRVNLERALKVGERLGGHFVTGHIDCTARIKRLKVGKGNAKLEMVLPKECRRFVVPKGSIAVDGVSLTVGEVTGEGFSVYLIPHTLNNTTLGLKRQGQQVNIEVDMLAKYAFGHKKEKASSVDMKFLKTHGFVK